MTITSRPVRIGPGLWAQGASSASFVLILTLTLPLPPSSPVITLATPFLVFYVSETAFPHFQMSGVLAVVSFGLVYASPWGKVRLDPRAVHFLHEFWAMVGHIVNLIIFVLAGSCVCARV